MDDANLIESGRVEHPVKRILHNTHHHAHAKLRGHDVEQEVVQHGGEIEPAPADDLQIGKVDLPQLAGRGGLMVAFGELD